MNQQSQSSVERSPPLHDSQQQQQQQGTSSIGHQQQQQPEDRGIKRKADEMIGNSENV
ncbi:hypothetical protein X777_16173 [Ooceraea biroi]|uniref:Uncharacterized protein n=1 Tax=Ooceraea biroi TaxID=2015173 RepID=A0A026WV91_OOCBI|nr:hypothetical protein X777_16173 [Ooceraea biroi]